MRMPSALKKAGKVIDMTVSIVANQAIVKPNYRIRPKARAELLFNLGWSGVAVTRGIKQDDFGSQYITSAVALNSAAFENLVKFRNGKGQAAPQSMRWHDRLLVVRGICYPRHCSASP